MPLARVGTSSARQEPRSRNRAAENPVPNPGFRRSFRLPYVAPALGHLASGCRILDPAQRGLMLGFEGQASDPPPTRTRPPESPSPSGLRRPRNCAPVSRPLRPPPPPPPPLLFDGIGDRGLQP